MAGAIESRSMSTAESCFVRFGVVDLARPDMRTLLMRRFARHDEYGNKSFSAGSFVYATSQWPNPTASLPLKPNARSHSLNELERALSTLSSVPA
ncbi:hypothetical protein WS71_26370 [Burkholderia mayonis]|uniref:Uncharacterized protein n=1 Tax=Burkholderia mayonis TaxID=1385591 RepID=A0A1B4G446_9BURK|nr:hypothetical protein WS71_26370 [Burkholderia mayonis]KVE53122.1 hypothetical protein WS71_07575 [Burkholderia mayonis]